MFALSLHQLYDSDNEAALENSTRDIAFLLEIFDVMKL